MSKTKAIGFAYPTSITAARMKRALQGCYTVDIWDHTGKGTTTTVAGPFGTVSEAEQHADTFLAHIPYDPMYRRHSLSGSQFRKMPLPVDLVQPSAFMQAGR